jgi:hypothetical protein
MTGGPGPVAAPGVKRWARIVEVTHTHPAEKVFELILADEPPAGQAVYRAKHLDSLYPYSDPVADLRSHSNRS